MAGLDFAIFDADNHYYEAEEAFTRHIDPRMKRRAIEWAMVDGRKTLLVAGKVNRFIPNPTFDPVAKPGCLEQYYRGHNPKNLSMRELFGQLEPIHRAYRERDERLRVMDAQGIERSFLFPTLGVGMEEALRGDPEALCAAFHAFNAWLAEDWGFAWRERLYGAPMISLVDPAKAVAELEWVLARDARLVCLRAAPVPAPDRSRSLGDPLYDPFWARAQEAGVLVAFHGGDHGYNKYADDWGEGGDFRAFAGTPLRGLVSADRAPFDTFAALICHGVFDRFPGLRMASVEMGSDWVRELLRKLQKSFGQAAGAYREDPVEAFKRHVWVSPFHEEDLRGMADLIGVERMLMGSDFPHAEGIAVPSDYVNELKGFSPREVRLVMRENALQLAERRPVR
jgi:predicted TIM-barrel fold metal-dependent hydrolase